MEYKKILLFGATGHLGKAIAAELKNQGYAFTAVVRNTGKAAELAAFTQDHLVLDVTDKKALEGICNGYDAVISALGKSVSPNEKSTPGFADIDLNVNSNILEEAKKSGVKKFVYVSALHSERYLHLEYFRVHHAFSERLKASGLNYSVIKPPAIFSAFIDMIDMAKKGRLLTLGSGDKKTNPIYEGDLAKVCVASLNETNAVIEAGGGEMYTRKELNEVIQQCVAPGRAVRSVPVGLMRMSLPLIRLFDKNSFDKFAFSIAL